MKKKINSYRDLSRISNYLDGLVSNSNFGFLNFADWDYYKIALGLVLTDRVGRLGEFTSNRYFQDALSVKTLPSIAVLDSFLADEKKIFFISKRLVDLMVMNSHITHSGNFTKPSFEDMSSLLLSYLGGSGELTSFISDDALFGQSQVEFFEKNGYLIIENFLGDSLIEETRERILEIAALEDAQGLAYYYGNNDLLQRVYNLLNKDKLFHQYIDDSRVFSIMNQIFDRNTLHDKFLLSSFHANILNPGGEEQIIHVDSAVPEPLPPWIIRANINFLLENYTESNGSTLVIPGSHKRFNKPNKADQNSPELVKLIAPKGSIVIWTGHIWHKSGTNLSNKPRVALLACFAASFLKEMVNEEDYAYLLDDEMKKSMSDNLKSLIGLNYGVKKGSIY